MTRSLAVTSENLPGTYNLFGKTAATQEVLGNCLELTSPKWRKCAVLSKTGCTTVLWLL